MTDHITIVSGLPRSGTSMMMQMLDAGGMEILTDHIRKADADNPHGYFELEKAKKIKEDASWLPDARGKAFKIVSMLLYALPAEYQYRIIFMKRDMAEILASQSRMLRRLNKESSTNDAEMGRLFGKHLAEIEAWLGRQTDMETMTVNFRDVIASPAAVAVAVNRFLGAVLDAGNMVRAVDPALYRNKAETMP